MEWRSSHGGNCWGCRQPKPESAERGFSSGSRSVSLLVRIPHSRRARIYLDGHGANKSVANWQHCALTLVAVALTSLTSYLRSVQPWTWFRHHLLAKASGDGPTSRAWAPHGRLAQSSLRLRERHRVTNSRHRQQSLTYAHLEGCAHRKSPRSLWTSCIASSIFARSATQWWYRRQRFADTALRLVAC